MFRGFSVSGLCTFAIGERRLVSDESWENNDNGLFVRFALLELEGLLIYTEKVRLS